MMLPYAMKYWQEGLSPIPLFAGTKIPTISRWKPYEKSKPPEPLVKFWFKKNNVNLGLVIREDYIVVDFDTFGSYKVWQINHEDLAQTYTVKTGRGFHLYFHSAEKPEHTFKFQSGELKATGYVVAPPSIHSSGKLYEEILPLPILRIEHWQELHLRKIEPVNVALVAKEHSGLGIIAEIKKRLSVIEYLDSITTLRPLQNGKMLANCPFHDDHHPSMIVDHMAYCFSTNCQIGRRQLDVINLYAYWNRLGTREAIKRLATELAI